MTNNLINGGGGTSGACRLSSSTLPSILIVIVLICIQVREESVFSVANFNYESLISLIGKVGNTVSIFILFL